MRKGLILLIVTFLFSCNWKINKKQRLFTANNSLIECIGRFEIQSNNNLRTWTSGAYISFSFVGSSCEMTILDELKYGTYHNIISVIVDGGKAQKIHLKEYKNKFFIKGLNPKVKIHSVLICKNTEAAIGFIEFESIRCAKLIKQNKLKKLTIEFIGDSITCGFGNDCDTKTKNKGRWFEKHNAYFSYGPILARKYAVNWILSSVSGIGLTRSCCGQKNTLPEVYDRINFQKNGHEFIKNNENPNLICITLGQNDGFQEENKFISTYSLFVKKLVKRYPMTKIVCCSSPMAVQKLKDYQKGILNKLILNLRSSGFKNTYYFCYKGIYRSGYLFHPTISEHKKIASELGKFIENEKLL